MLKHPPSLSVRKYFHNSIGDTVCDTFLLQVFAQNMECGLPKEYLEYVIFFRGYIRE